MGCIGSKVTNNNPTEARRVTTAKTPVLLFNLPGNVRDTLLKCLSNDVMSGNGKQNDGAQLNIRFIDAPNQRNIRRYWLKELSTRRDFAAAIYLADIRDHAMLLLTAKTLNWFLRNTKSYNVLVVTIYNDEEQMSEFLSYLPAKTEMMKINENDPETTIPLIQQLKQVEIKYNEQKRMSTATTTLTFRQTL